MSRKSVVELTALWCYVFFTNVSWHHQRFLHVSFTVSCRSVQLQKYSAIFKHGEMQLCSSCWKTLL